MFIIKCYIIASILLVGVLMLAIGVCDDFPWKWLNILCQAIFTIIILFMLVSILALFIGAALKGTL